MIDVGARHTGRQLSDCHCGLFEDLGRGEVQYCSETYTRRYGGLRETEISYLSRSSKEL